MEFANSDNSEPSFLDQLNDIARKAPKVSKFLSSTKYSYGTDEHDTWSNGLLVFYEIIKYLEENVPSDLLPKEFHRREAFESDLSYYLGSDWELYMPRKPIKYYVAHLKEINENEPILLLAYVYHLYMALLTGAKRFLRKKGNLFRNLNCLEIEDLVYGSSVPTFDESIQTLMNRLREIVDCKASEFDEELKQRFLEESHRVFEFNEEIMSTVNGKVDSSWAFLVKLILLLFCIRYYFSPCDCRQQKK